MNELVLLDMEFETLNSKVKLRDIEFRVIPGNAEEILVGKSEMKRLNIPSLESMLDEVALDQTSSKNQIEVDIQEKVPVKTEECKTNAGESGMAFVNSSRKECAKRMSMVMNELLYSHDQKSVNKNDDGGDATIEELLVTKVNDLRCDKRQGSDVARSTTSNKVMFSEEKAAEIVREHREAVRIKKAKEGWPTTAKPSGHPKEVVKQETVADNEGGLVLEQIVEPLEQQEALVCSYVLCNS